MAELEKSLSLGKAEIIKEKNEKHIPSKVQADTLFTFTTHVDYVIDTISKKMISPRYCDEDITYLGVRKLRKLAYPMKCFCDINMHRLEDHLSWYGYYGLAFSKEWGMMNGIQPIQYINPNSELCRDFAKAFRTALTADSQTQTKTEKTLKDYLLHQLMYYKPYSGRIRNRNTNKMQRKCFTDECEWRFIPDVTKAGFQQVYYDEHILNAGVLRDLSNSMSEVQDISLSFEYSDLKYIIVKTMDDFRKLMRQLEAWGLDQTNEYELISKVIVWDNSKGDF